MAAQSKISFSYEGIGEMLRSEEMRAAMVTRAERVRVFAVARAPVYTGTGQDPHRGRYKASFRVESTNHGGSRNDRAAAMVVNDAPEAVHVEWGTRAHSAVLHTRDGRTLAVKIPAQAAQHVLGSSMMAAAGGE